MFGSIMHARCKTEEAATQLLAHARRYAETLATPSLISTEIAQEEGDPCSVWAVIHFTDREAYRANGERPETNAWYRTMLELLDGEPEWHDVSYLGMAERVSAPNRVG